MFSRFGRKSSPSPPPPPRKDHRSGRSSGKRRKERPAGSNTGRGVPTMGSSSTVPRSRDHPGHTTANTSTASPSGYGQNPPAQSSSSYSQTRGPGTQRAPPQIGDQDWMDCKGEWEISMDRCLYSGKDDPYGYQCMAWQEDYPHQHSIYLDDGTELGFCSADHRYQFGANGSKYPLRWPRHLHSDYETIAPVVSRPPTYSQIYPSPNQTVPSVQTSPTTYGLGQQDPVDVYSAGGQASSRNLPPFSQPQYETGPTGDPTRSVTFNVRSNETQYETPPIDFYSTSRSPLAPTMMPSPQSPVDLSSLGGPAFYGSDVGPLAHGFGTMSLSHNPAPHGQGPSDAHHEEGLSRDRPAGYRERTDGTIVDDDNVSILSGHETSYY